MNTLNKCGYNPMDDYSDSGFRRPPMDIPCICDYFARLMLLEDGGVFLHKEMGEMLNSPSTFFVEEDDHS